MSSDSARMQKSPKTPKYAFAEGDEELKDLATFINSMVEAYNKKYKTGQPGCARVIWQPRDVTTVKFKRGKPAPFVIAGTNESMLAARYISGQYQIVVVQQRQDSTASTFNDGRPSIVVPKKGGGARWYKWEPVSCSKDPIPDAEYVERLFPWESKGTPRATPAPSRASRAVSEKRGRSVRRSFRESVIEEDEEEREEGEEDAEEEEVDEPPKKKEKKNKISPATPSTIKTYFKDSPQSAQHSARLQTPVSLVAVQPATVNSESNTPQLQTPLKTVRSSHLPGPDLDFPGSDDTILKSTEKSISPESTIDTHNKDSTPSSELASTLSGRTLVSTDHSTPTPTSISAEASSNSNTKELFIPTTGSAPRASLNFVFKNSLAEKILRTIPAAKITSGKRIFEHALCSGIADLSTSVLQVVIGEQTVFILRDYKEDFDALLVKIRDMKEGELVTVMPITWEE